MKYEHIEMIGDDTNVRYLLKKEEHNTLIVIGVNPSKATDKKTDQTMVRIMGLAERNGYDGFIMLNIYPQRSTKPSELDKDMNIELHNNNLKHIASEINNHESATILLAFGDSIGCRSYLKSCLKDIIALFNIEKFQWRQIGVPTKNGNPRHPSRTGYCDFTTFDIRKYLDCNS